MLLELRSMGPARREPLTMALARGRCRWSCAGRRLRCAGPWCGALGFELLNPARQLLETFCRLCWSSRRSSWTLGSVLCVCALALPARLANR